MISNEELIAQVKIVREKAHKAPKCISGTTEEPYTSGDAWARHTNDLLALVREVDRRGISHFEAMPDCDPRNWRTRNDR